MVTVRGFCIIENIVRYQNSEIAASGNVTARPVKDDLVLVDLNRGEYYSLNDTGRHVWEELTLASDLDDLVERLARHFEGDRESIRRDVEAIIDDLLERRLLTRQVSPR